MSSLGPRATTVVVGDGQGATETAEKLAAAEDRIDACALEEPPALDELRERGADCVVVLDEGDAVDRLARVRSVAPTLPAFVVTDDPEVASAAVEAGASDYLLDGPAVATQVLVRRILDAVGSRDGLESDLRDLLAITSMREEFGAKVDAALELGCERFGLGIGFLSAIDSDFEVLSARGDHPKIQPGGRERLSRTYCRKTIDGDGPLAVENAPEQGWADDPAYQRYGLSCYLGAKVVVDGEVYGTLCFADTEKRVTFHDADVTVVDLMAKWLGYELERRRHVEELESHNERFDELARTLSHDLGNLLEALRGDIEYVRKTGELDRLERAERTHERTSELLDHMVALVRAGQRIEDRTEVDLAVAVREAWTHVGCPENDLEVSVAGDASVQADRRRLLQLLENLLGNSVAHGGEDVTVHVGTVDGGFYVEDDGTGIPEGKYERVFETGVSDDGTGLGLSVVDEVATAHGWCVHATEGTEGGARFEVTDVPGLRSTTRADRER
jgi:GAF domain-containing protein